MNKFVLDYILSRDISFILAGANKELSSPLPQYGLELPELL